MKIPEIIRTPSGDIFQHQEIFKHVGEAKEKKGFPKLVFVGIGVAAVAVAAFLILRAKPAPKNDPNLTAAQTVIQTEVPAQPAVDAPPPVVKPQPVKPEPKPAAKKAEPAAPIAEGIVDPIISAGALPLSPTKTEGSDALRAPPRTLRPRPTRPGRRADN